MFIYYLFRLLQFNNVIIHIFYGFTYFKIEHLDLHNFNCTLQSNKFIRNKCDNSLASIL